MRWLLLLAACQGFELDLERMKDQPNARPYEASPYFPDGRAMRVPPSNTVPHGERATPAPVVDRALVTRGRERFEIYCAACHGRLGDGRSEVARNMELRKPPPLVASPVREFPDERLFKVISNGYGLMPSYAAELPAPDRWAVVAYVRALQLSQSVRLDTLPKTLRDVAEKALP
jgi:mono/diheme cytochrome c family protein